MHPVSRRHFAAVAGAAACSQLGAASRIPVALQLFSVRTECEKDPEGTLSFIRDVGYEGVEFAGFYGRTAEQWKRILEERSLRCCGSHTVLGDLTERNLQKTIEFNRILGNRNLIVPGLPGEYHESAASWKRAATLFNQIAGRLKPVGMRVGYHNHAIEFQERDGKLPWKILFEETLPEVILQLDLGNARIGGADPVALIKKYPHRAKTVHVKDYLPDKPDALIGSSRFDWGAFLNACESLGGTEWYIIEHDSPDREEVRQSFDRFRDVRRAAGQRSGR